MNLIYTIAGVATIIAGAAILLSGYFGKAGAKSVASGDVKPLDSFQFVFGGFLIAIGIVVFFRQVLAAVGVGTDSANPWLFNWVQKIFSDAAAGNLPMLQ